MLDKGTPRLEVKNSERNRKLENFVSLEPLVCEVLLYCDTTGEIGAMQARKDGWTDTETNRHCGRNSYLECYHNCNRFILNENNKTLCEMTMV